MPVYTIFKSERKAATLDKDGKPLACLSFTIDGQETMKWFDPCTVPGLPETYYVDRCINRLKAGKSGVFGGPGVAVASDGRFAKVTRGEIRACVFLESPRAWRYELDGEACEATYPTENMAKEACAVKAFMTRGKLGRLKEVEVEFEAVHGKPGKASVKDNRIVVEAANDEIHVVGFAQSGGVKFAQTIPVPE